MPALNSEAIPYEVTAGGFSGVSSPTRQPSPRCHYLSKSLVYPPYVAAFLVPKNLNLPRLLSAAGLSDWQKSKRLAKLLYLVDTVVREPSRKGNGAESEAIPLSSLRLRAAVGSNYCDEALRILQALHVFDTPTKHLSTAAAHRCNRRPTCKGYRLTAAYSGKTLTSIPCPDPVMAARLQRLHTLRTEEAIGDSPDLRFLLENLQRCSLSTEAAARLKSVLRSECKAERKTAWSVTFDELTHGFRWLRTDEKTGRVFHNVTSLPRDLRECLLIDGEPAVEIDISNAQPHLMASLYPADCPERASYLAVTGAGRFYEHLLKNALAAQKARFAALDRQALKKQVLTALNGYLSPSLSPILSTLGKAFPVLARRIQETKQGSRNRLPLLLQKIEAEIVIGRVLPRIRNELPGVRVVTIHDCLMAPQWAAPAVAKILRDEVVSRIGGTVTLKFKPA